MQKLIQINSDDRINRSYTFSSDFTVNLGAESLQSVKAVYLKEVQFANTAYNINLTNNSFWATSGGDDYEVTIPVGQYNITELMAALIAAWTVVDGASLTITLNALTGKLTFTSDIAATFSSHRNHISLGIPEAQAPVNPMARVLGITNRQTAAANVHVASSVPDLSGLRSLYICSNTLSGGSCITSRGQKISLLDSVPVDVPYGSVKHHSSEGYTDSHTYTDELYNNISSIDIKLIDERGNPVDLNGSSINIILMVLV